MQTTVPRKRFAKCIVHIGTEKTGSTAIQEHLKHNRDGLLEAGVLYPASAGRVYASQIEFVGAIHNQPWVQDIGQALGIEDEQGQAAFRQRLSTELEKEFEKHPEAHTLLISSEHFQSRLHGPVMIGKLKAFLDPWVETFEIIVYFRRQDQVSLALEATRLKSTIQLKAIQPLNTFRTMPRYFAYDTIHENWETVFGKAAMKARLYQPKAWPDEDIVQDFCAACGLPSPTARAHRPNRSLNRKGFHFLHALNRVYPAENGYGQDPRRAALVKLIAQQYAGHYYPIGRAEAETKYAMFAETNERLRQMAFPDYPAPLFDEDFSYYPEIPEPSEPSYDDAVEIATFIWNARIDALPQPRLRDQLKRLFRK